MQHADAVARLAADLVRLDSRSFVSNRAVADRIAAELEGFALERLDYADAAGVAKQVIVAHRGPPGGVALSGHMDTVPDTGWTDDPFSGRIDAEGVLHGLGAADMKGPLAACIVAARTLPAHLPATLLITTDEETTKMGARRIADHSALARRRRHAASWWPSPRGCCRCAATAATSTSSQWRRGCRRIPRSAWAATPTGR
ncbi:M20/M25/M40 family metallo-hydrolase [Teichococcus aestuarii]|uniref:M20/M25/M40 family metallo-hydrolase n=1 Tax=Teichococcus aestuarii TaxID=568898 RepID=UPI00361FB34A